MDKDQQERDINSTLLKMKPAGGRDKVGNLIIEVPDDGDLVPIDRFERVMALDAKIDRDELNTFLDGLVSSVCYTRNEENVVIDASLPQLPHELFTIYLMWSEVRNEWFAVTCIYWDDATDWSNDFLYDGPFEISDRYKRILLKAYKLTEDDIELSNIASTDPSHLTLAAKKAAVKSAEASQGEGSLPN